MFNCLAFKVVLVFTNVSEISNAVHTVGRLGGVEVWSFSRKIFSKKLAVL